MPDRTLDSQLAYGQALVDRGDEAGAVYACRQILEALPRCVEAYAVLAQAMLLRGQSNRAEALWARVLSVDPENAEAALGMAVVQQDRGVYQDAQAWLQRALECASEAALNSRGWLWTRAEVIERDSTGELSRAGLAYTMLRSCMYAHARVELQAALEETPERDDLAVALAVASYRSTDASAAGEVCEALLARLPECLKALLIWGHLHLGTEGDAQARELLRRAQMLDPQNRVAQRLFGEDSPLPARSVRVPTEDTGDPLALPYTEAYDEIDEEEDEGPLPSLQSIL